MLKNELNISGETEKANRLTNLWSTLGDSSLSAEECLAKRVNSLQIKSQYRYQYEMLRHLQDNTLNAPEKVSKAEKAFMAPSATLHELEEPVTEGIDILNIRQETIETYIFTSVIKDGGDGMGDCSVHKERGDRILPDKAFRYAFYLVEIYLELNGQHVTLYEYENPKTVKHNRPLLEAIADENSKSSATVCILPIETERLSLNEEFWQSM